MAGANPLFTEGFFFYSSMYDDTVIGEFYRKISAEAYSQATEYQHGMIGRLRDQYTGKIVYNASCGNLAIDNKYNVKMGLPLNSYTVKIPRFIIPYSNKKRFIRKYGYDNCIIPIADFYTETQLFDKYPSVHIGPHRIMTNLSFILNRDRTVTLAILENGEPFSAKDLVTSLREDDTIIIFLNEQDRIFSVPNNDRESNPFVEALPDTSVTPAENYYLTIPYSSSLLSNIAPQVQHKYFNSWDMIMNGTSSGNEVYTTTVIISLLGIDKQNDKITFLISEDSLNAIKAMLNVSGFRFPFDLYFIERPNRRSISAYEYDPLAAPIMNLNYNENPAGNINIEIYECDEHYHKGRRLYDPDLVQLYYPNIFDFTHMNVNKKDLLIEVIEYPSSYTNQVMHNSLQPLFDSLGQDFYTEFTVNNYDVNLDGSRAKVKEFHPQHFPVTFDDYLDSPYYKNIRGYLADKVCQTLASDPWLISEYYRLLNNRNPRIITTSGTPRKYGLTIDGKLQGEYSAGIEPVMNTKIASQNADDVLHFSEPHTYLMYRSNEEEVPSMLYFNGRYIKPTATRFWSGMNYVFVPTRLIQQIKDISQRNHDNADIVANGKKLMESCAPVTLDFFPGTHSSIVRIPTFQFTVESMEDTFRMFEDLKDEKISLDQLVFFNADTKEIIYDWTDLFDVVLEVNSTEYDSSQGSELLKFEKSRPLLYLLTILNEIYATNDVTPILLRAEPERISYQDTIKDLLDSGAITEEQAKMFGDKKFDPSDLILVPKDVSLLGMTIVVSCNHFKAEANFSARVFEHVEGVGYRHSLANNNTDYFPTKEENWRNFMVFKDGQYVSDAWIEHDKFYGSAITIWLPETANLEDADEVIYVHLPIRTIYESFDMVSSVRYMKAGDKSKASISTIWPIDDDYTNGIALEASWDKPDNPMIPFEANENAKFTKNGYRLPPMSKSTYNARHTFYDPDRAKYMTTAIRVDLNKGPGTVCALPCGVPIIRWEDHREKDVLDIIW